VVESVAYAIRDVVEVMEENSLSIDELRVTGGQARSPVWNQIKADICQKRILVPDQQDAELLGDACVGLYALGHYADLAAAAESVVRIRKAHEPNPRLKGRYDELFALYRASYRGLRDVFGRLARVPVEEEA
jgi:xylulokinase